MATLTPPFDPPPPAPSDPPLIDPKTHPDSLLGRVSARWAGHDLETTFQSEVASLLGRTSRKFPGAQPVSFAASHLQELKKRDYWVCEKTDGERFLLWMTQDGPNPLVYFINRKNEYYWVPEFVFPHHEKQGDFHRDTILDGELVEDKYPDGRREMVFLVFDLLVIDGKDMMERTLDKRMAYFKEFVLKPYKEKGGRGPFIVRDKRIEFAYAMDTMFNEVIPKVKEVHGNDGLIFTCRETRYKAGTDENVLKWKPPEENTVDFLMHVVWGVDEEGEVDYEVLPRACELWVFYGESRGEVEYRRHAELYVTEEEWEGWKRGGKAVQDSVVECYQEEVVVNGNGNGNGYADGNGVGGAMKRWRWYRFREDKAEANHVSTYQSVIESIEDRVTQADLLREQAEIRDCWKRRQSQATGR